MLQTLNQRMCKKLSCGLGPAFSLELYPSLAYITVSFLVVSRYSQGMTVYQSYLKCYCEGCNLGCGNKAATEPDFCLAYFQNEQQLLFLTLVSVGGVVVINQVFHCDLLNQA